MTCRCSVSWTPMQMPCMPVCAKHLGWLLQSRHRISSDLHKAEFDPSGLPVDHQLDGALHRLIAAADALKHR